MSTTAANHMTVAESEACSPEGILQLGLGFWASKTLLSAVELGLFTELASGPLDGEALQKRLGLHRRGARDFLDALVALGMLEREGDIYRNTPATDRYLDRGKPTYVGGMLAVAATRIYANWASLTEALRTGKPQNGTEDDEDLFDMLYSNPDNLVMFAQAMTGGSLQAAEALARRFPWTDYRTFIDIGTAEGRVPVEIASAHPHLTGGGYDLPPMRPVFEAYAERRGLADRLRFHPGDFLKEPLPPADVLVMGHILHDWNLEVKRTLLAKAYAALPKRGALIVHDQIIDDERRQNAAGLLMSLNMLVNTRGGFDYTRANGIGWMREAGFTDVRFEHLAGPHSMIVGIK
ncbi:acetylserotonin O-methyltransferase [Rhizobium sullae]|uniref:Acetylserotonin O-methyltransferase n=1 Tax=Rhizobium sullae TaxID=50338 RepID=A0ABY5XW75_RHISU|nr:acetylserotonin O-methyltransferase [Rhizobium sullae]UWU18872.1 acetylserotonin O-methyltransferase [Rhizobium sullae]